MTEERFENQLIHEKSPYLLQHARNPVHWYPWGEKAFELARAEDKPIFLSIGYATCHWCHVMEKETFQNVEIAALMNDTFINIKVDREEHPEVDSLYMEFAQALMSSAGGWPLNVILTPDLKPFFAVTYLPPKAQKGLIGMDQFVSQIKLLWQSEERAILVDQADKVVELFKKNSKTFGADLPDEEDLQNAVQMLFDIADPIFGGIKGEPKFPLGYQAEFLLEYSKTNKDSRSLFYIELTLQKMAQGGIFDQLGGGFARYCIDERWHIPHFEKMLYDNAILAKTYLQAYRYTKKPLFGEVCRSILDYTLREMSGKEGGFFSGEDADSEGEEGKFYTWSAKEIEQTLGDQEGKLFCQLFGVTEEGNFEGKNILHVEADPGELAKLLGVDEGQLKEQIALLKIKLLEKRNQRIKPFKDDKVITAWNGLMLDAMVQAGSCFDNSPYTEAAVKTANWIKKQLWIKGELLRRYREGDARFSGGLDDYAFLIKGVLSLFECGLGSEYLQWAMELSEVLEKEYKTPNGAYYQTKEDRFLLMRKCEFYDGAEPSGNAIHCENLLRLYQITQNEKYLTSAEDILRAAQSFIETFPPGACYNLIALQRYLDQKAPLVVVAFNKDRAFEKEIKHALGSQFTPHRATIFKYQDDPLLNTLIPPTANQNCVDGKTSVYICRDFHCEKPLVDLPEILKAFETF